MSLRWKLTLWYAATTSLILAAFVGADLYGQSQKFSGEHLLREELWEHGWLALVTLVCVSLVGHFVIGRALRPVREMASTAKTITAEDLSRRIPTRSRDELGELSETLNAMIARLETSFQRVAQFANVVAHELNTPLATIKGELELMRRRERTREEYEAMVPRLQRQIERLSGLVDNLLLLSRMESYTAELPFSEVQLDEIVLEVYEEYETSAVQAGLVLRVDVPEGLAITGERALLKQLIDNLVSNAIRYTDRGGTVDLSLAASADGARLRVADTGRGISAEALPHVFEPFYRERGAGPQSSPGVGLGLAIVRRVADLHRCTLDLQSTPGQGTTVTVTWPQAGD